MNVKIKTIIIIITIIVVFFSNFIVFINLKRKIKSI